MQNPKDTADTYDDAQQRLTTPQSVGDITHTSPQSADSNVQNRKRKHGGDEDDGPPPRRTSFQRVSPADSMQDIQGAGFMPVNSTGNYSSLPPSQSTHSHPPSTSMNGVSSAERKLSEMGPIISQMSMSQSSVPGDANLDPSFGLLSPSARHESISQAPTAPAPAPMPPVRSTSSASQVSPSPITRPQVGSDEWHRVRKDNHKEVERRRRETINEGINELAKIVPGCEKNKGSILQRTVQYINELKDEIKKSGEKTSMEKLLTDQAIRDLSNTNEKLKQECERAWREAETWKKVISSRGSDNDASGSQQ